MAHPFQASEVDMTHSWLLTRTRLAFGVGLFGVAAFGTACGALPGVSDAMGTDYTKREKATCEAPKGQSRFLVVDWESVDRAELEARAQRGLAVVKYDGCAIELMKRCSLKSTATYQYVGVTPKRDIVVMRDANEIYANIPLSAAKLEGHLRKNGSLDVGMTIVGQWDFASAIPAPSELEGDCEGATHVVSSVTVGAYEFAAGNAIDAGASVDILGAGAGAKQAQQKELLSRDGDEAACAKAAAGDQKPPFGCGALLRVEMVALGAERKTEPTCPTGTTWDGAQCASTSNATTCPEGMIAEKYRGCVAKRPSTEPTKSERIAAAPAGSFVAPIKTSCSGLDDCKKRCAENDPQGCLGVGASLRGTLKPGKATSEGAEAEKAFTVACDGKAFDACTALGEMKFQGLGVAKNDAAARAMLERGCDGGDPVGCNDVGLMLTSGASQDPAAAAKYFERACTSTSAVGCLGLGLLIRDGRAMVKDEARAKQLFKRACDAKVAPACKLL